MDPSSWIGRDVDGRYRVEAVLGVGGMGTVLRATHQFTGVPVALKILHAQFGLDEQARDRFYAEAHAPNAIGHPAIVKVSDAGRTADGTLYMAMELLSGRSLRAAAARRELAPEQIRRICAELLEPLGQAHACGFVHRDLKPDNVFLCAPGDTVKLLDFGIAKMLDDHQQRTAVGAVLGTPAYMAPEQLADASKVDARADLWAVGVILYELIAGRLPYAGTTVNELLAAVAGGALIPIRQVMPDAPVELEQFFARALAIDPRRRFGAAQEMAPAIAALRWGASLPHVAPAPAPTQRDATVASLPPAPTPTPMAPVPSVPPRSRLPLVVGAIAIAAIVAGIAIAVSSRGRPAAPGVAPGDAAPSLAEEAPSTPVPVEPAAPTCAERCARLATQCGTHLPSCEQDCVQQEAAFTECFDRSMRDCRDGALCGFAKLCDGREPRGTATCRQVATCQERCRVGDIPCGCACDVQLDPRHALELGKYNTCIFRAFSAGCRTLDCALVRCPAENRDCK